MNKKAERCRELYRKKMYEKLASSHPILIRGLVYCETCHRVEKVDSAKAMRYGWPECCGHTMTLDVPEEFLEYNVRN